MNQSSQATTSHPEPRPRVAVLIPCLNEGASIGRVVADFRAALPWAAIHVFDNGSSDDTVERAVDAGAQLGREPRAGKGRVVRRMFAEVEADVFVMVDGDGTYDAAHASEMVNMLTDNQLDMVIANRRSPLDLPERRGHRFGNAVFSVAVTRLFREQVGDLFSGYRVLSRRLVKSFPTQATGFEIETDLTIHCLELGLATGETEADYRPRDEDVTESKLRTIPDGLRIATRIMSLFRHVRPLAFFSILGLLATAMAWILGGIIIAEYASSGVVLRIPSAILATGLQLVGLLLFAIGLILDSVAAGRREQKLMAYLATSARAPDQ